MIIFKLFNFDKLLTEKYLFKNNYISCCLHFIVYNLKLDYNDPKLTYLIVTITIVAVII